MTPPMRYVGVAVVPLATGFAYVRWLKRRGGGCAVACLKGRGGGGGVRGVVSRG